MTILDDDQPPPPPPPTFTIGGTVDGLQGSGLVLSNLGAAVPVSANGSFTFPGTALDRPVLRGQRQDPAAQPRSVVHGAERHRSGGYRERDRYRRALRRRGAPVGVGFHVRDRRPRHDAGQRGGQGGADPARRAHRHRRPARGRADLPLPVRRHPPRRGGESRPELRYRRDRDHRVSAATTTRPSTPRCCPTAGSWPSAKPTPPDWRTPTSASCATPPTATPTPRSAPTGIETHRPHGPRRRRQRGRGPARRQDRRRRGRGDRPGPTSISRSCATTPTGRSTRASAATGSSPPTSAPSTTASPTIAVQPDGKIVAVGATDQNVALARYLPDGTARPDLRRRRDRGQRHRHQRVANGVADHPRRDDPDRRHPRRPQRTRPDRRQLRPQRQAEPRVRQRRRRPGRPQRRRRLRRRPRRERQRRHRLVGSAAHQPPPSATWRSSASNPTARSTRP